MNELKTMEVETKWGMLKVSQSTDPSYPGVDVEFISNEGEMFGLSRPRVLIEVADVNSESPELRALCWSDPGSEEFVEDVTLANLNNLTPPIEVASNTLAGMITDSFYKYDPVEFDNQYDSMEECVSNVKEALISLRLAAMYNSVVQVAGIESELFGSLVKFESMYLPDSIYYYTLDGGYVHVQSYSEGGVDYTVWGRVNDELVDLEGGIIEDKYYTLYDALDHLKTEYNLTLVGEYFEGYPEDCF